MLFRSDLAIRSNLSKSYIEELERGDKNNPSFSTVEKLADALNVMIDDLRKPLIQYKVDQQLV